MCVTQTCIHITYVYNVLLHLFCFSVWLPKILSIIHNHYYCSYCNHSNIRYRFHFEMVRQCFTSYVAVNNWDHDISCKYSLLLPHEFFFLLLLKKYIRYCDLKLIWEWKWRRSRYYVIIYRYLISKWRNKQAACLVVSGTLTHISCSANQSFKSRRFIGHHTPAIITRSAECL